MTTPVLSPAYGRDYKSKAAVQADWDADKDFVNESQLITGGGMYINQADCRGTFKKVQIYYSRKTKSAIFEVK